MSLHPTPDELIDKKRSLEYWESTDGDVNGMLGGIPGIGGFGSVTRVDLQGSRTFLARLGIGTKNGRYSISSALEGGSGIGRVTEGLLLRVCEHVDVVEPITKFTSGLQSKQGVRNIYNIGLEEWQPVEGFMYDLFWLQWCLGHLTDIQLVAFLQRAKAALTPGSGVVIIKENLSTVDKDLFDETDSSVTRRDESFRAIFESAGYNVIKTELQRGLPEIPPKRLFPVKMYALRPQGWS